MLLYGSTCTNCEITRNKVDGEPTEVAIVKAAIEEKLNNIEINNMTIILIKG